MGEVLERWNEHCQQMLNHAPAARCPELDDAAANAVPADDVRTNPRGGPGGDQETP